MNGWPAVLGLASFLLGSSPGAPGLAAQGTPPTRTFTTANVNVIHRAGQGSGVVTVRLYLLGGSQQLGDAPDGVEAVWLGATQLAVERDLSAVGALGALEASPDWSVTGFTTLLRYWEDAWPTWAEGLTDAGTWGTAFERARQERLGEARHRRSQPAIVAGEIAWRRAFSGHPYERHTEGTPESIERLTLEGVASYAKDALVASRMLLVVVGDIPRKDVEASVEASFGRLPYGTYSRALPPDVATQENEMEIRDQPQATSYIVGQVIGPRPGSRDYLAFELATYLLSAQLNAVIRRENSLSYAAYADFNRNAVPSATIRVTTADPRSAYPLILRQMEWLQSVREHRQGELGWYLDQFVLDELTRALSPETQADDLAWAEVFFGDPELADGRIAALRKVSPRDIQRVALEYFPRFQFAFVGNAALLRP